jgi:aspartate dehydrogenase
MVFDTVPGVGRDREIRVAIAGLGTVGREVATQICGGDDALSRYKLTAVASGRVEPATAFLQEIGSDARFVPLEQLPAEADIVIECAPAAVFGTVARATIDAGKLLVPLSVSSLLANWDLVERARNIPGAAIHVPTGAFLGLDAVQGLAVATVDSVRMITRKPVRGLIKAPYVRDNGIDLQGISEPVQIFNGTVREAAVGFPENINVAVALSMAGIGPDRTTIEVWADPALRVNTHSVVAEGSAASFEMSIRNVPSSNAATGLLTAQSVIALLRKLDAPLRIGT